MPRSSAPKRSTGSRKTYTRECAQCHESFEAPGEFHSYRRKFCSMQCVAAYNRARAAASYPPREEVIRLYVDDGLSDVELGRHYGRSHNWSLKVRKHYAIPGRPARRKPRAQKSDRARFELALKREPRCRNCKTENRQLHLHHAVPRSLSSAGKFDLRNGVPLCVRCHLGWHHGQVAILRSIFTPEEWAFIETLIGPGWLDRKYPVKAEPIQRCKRGHLRIPANLDSLGRCRRCATLNARRYRAKTRKAKAAGG